MQVKKAKENIRPSDYDVVRVKSMGHITEVFYQTRKSLGGYITKLDKDHYVDNRTGEVCEFTHSDSRADDLQSVSRSLSMGRDIINANVTDVTNCRWCTVTYRQRETADQECVPVTDAKRIKVDFQHFIRRLHVLYGEFEYITAAEPQGSGSWHYHVLFIFPGKAPYMPNKTVADAWGQGYVTIKKLDDVDNVGAYLTAYLGDMELAESKKCGTYQNHAALKDVQYKDEDGKQQTKRYVKGARLLMYPPGFHIFRWSKGIIKPDIVLLEEKEAQEKVSAATLTFEKTVHLIDPDHEFESTLNYRYYNSKRKEKQYIQAAVNEL